MKKSSDTESLETSLSSFLFWYRLIPHSTTGVAPAELLPGRIPHSQLDLLKPELSAKVQLRQESQKRNHDIHAKQREFKVGDKVFVKEFPTGKNWLDGTITEIHILLCYLYT